MRTCCGALLALGLLSAWPHAQSVTLHVAQVPPPPDVEAPPPDATETSARMFWKVLRPGTGRQHPFSPDRVTVNYTIWTTDGVTVDSSRSRSTPSVLRLDATMITGLREGLEDMVVGEQRRLWLPADHAHGERLDRLSGKLTIDVEIVAIEPPALPTPPDVEAPPAEASGTATGLKSVVLREGAGADHPFPQSTVTIHYSGWTTDGDLFDSSLLRNQPATVRVDRLIPGLSEGLRLMAQGEKRRFWIPEALAYDGISPPFGMLVFEVDLLDIAKSLRISGAPGTITVMTNQPSWAYSVLRPDRTQFGWRGPHTFPDQVPGQYWIIPDDVAGWTCRVTASPADLILQGGQTLTITLEYKKTRP